MLLLQARTAYPCGSAAPRRTTAVRVTRALPGPEASAVIRTVETSGGVWLGWTAGWPAGDDPIVDVKASAAATTGSVVAGSGSGGPNIVKCGRIAISTGG